ncbi:hypothetical protein WJX72_010006 [[Myrmecia] bisecta]|uniref:ASCH domain-containing protein n=1 Tax=[Myrmecia] bisecta TaxID=41462 RepID=A0AAW1PH54_9CHLO
MPAAADELSLSCLSLHQPWASLLVYGIKRIEGRGWPTNHRGRVWIHSTTRRPTSEEVQELEDFYRMVHRQEGREPVFPKRYPTSVLLGCVDVVDCLMAEQVEAWSGLPESIKMEIGSPYCYLCEVPRKVPVHQSMRGWPKMWNIPEDVAEAMLPLLQPCRGAGPTPFSWGQFPTPVFASNVRLPRSTRRDAFAKRFHARDSSSSNPTSPKKSKSVPSRMRVTAAQRCASEPDGNTSAGSIPTMAKPGILAVEQPGETMIEDQAMAAADDWQQVPTRRKASTARAQRMEALGAAGDGPEKPLHTNKFGALAFVPRQVMRGRKP